MLTLLDALVGLVSLVLEFIPTTWLLAGMVLAVSLELLGVPVAEVVVGGLLDVGHTVGVTVYDWLVAFLEGLLSEAGWSL